MADKADYVFTRDFLDNNRINLMNTFWNKTFGYLLHPRIPTGTSDLSVADVGTGTGIWLFDLREQIKNARFVGLDISFDATPPVETLPADVTLRRWDVRTDVPQDLIGAFDVVHVRFFAFVLLNEEVPDVVAKLYSMLKPGGYLQWGEPDIKTLRFAKTKPELETDNLVALFQLLAVQDTRLQPTWVETLTDIFSEKGFVDVEKDTQDAPPHIAFMFHEAGLMMHELVARKTKNETMARELARLLPAAVEETRQGAYVTSLRCIITGKKP